MLKGSLMMTMHKKGSTERDEIEILDLNLYSRMNSNLYKIEKAQFDISFLWQCFNLSFSSK